MPNDLLPQTEDTAVINEWLTEKLASRDPESIKAAADYVEDFTRMYIRETGVTREIIPFEFATSFDRQHWTTAPVKVIDREPDQPPAVSVGFGSVPSYMYMRSPRYAVTFSRIFTDTFTADVLDLRTYVMDIRQVLSDNAVKDILAEEDNRFFETIDSLVGNPGDATSIAAKYTGVPQHIAISGLTRDSIVELRKILPKAKNKLQATTAIINQITAADVLKFTFNEIGGDLSKDLFVSGRVPRHFMGLDWIITNKRNVVADNVIYLFADPKFLGKAYEAERPTMFIENKGYFVSFFLYESIGTAIGNLAAVGKVTLT